MNKRNNIRIIIICGLFLLIGSGLGFLAGTINTKNSTSDKEEASVSIGYEQAVCDIENSYEGNFPQDKIIMYGSSSFRFWETMESDMAPLQVLNHGFGGATLDDALNYADRLVVAFRPSAVVIYCGTNDLGGMADGSIKNARQAYESSVALINYISYSLPGVKIFYVASSPQPLRWSVWEEEKKCNNLMKEYCSNYEHLYYIDTESVLLDSEGDFYKDYYLDDGLHFNEKGYEAWGSVIKDEVMKVME